MSSTFCDARSSWAVSITLCLAILLVPTSWAHGQDDAKATEETAKQADTKAEDTKAEDTKAGDDKADADKDEPKKEDPFAVPDGDVKELLAFIEKVKRTRVANLASFKQQIAAVVEAAKKVRSSESVELKDEVIAIKEQLGALRALARFDSSALKETEVLLEKLSTDPRDEIVKVYVSEDLQARAALAAKSNKEDLDKLVSDLTSHIKDGDFGRDRYSVANAVARGLSYSDHPELAADVYEQMSVLMSKSSDEGLQERADKMMGAARRLRLIGNFMEVKGTTAEGDEFDWSEYRGKVVLVDFWASWCGPCRAEVPNMKAALETYGDRGFAVVGVNLDRTREAYEKYVEREEIPWVSLMSDKEEERGWDNPLVKYYGVTGIPTAILVDQQGKAVSLSARGKELDRLLAELLPAPGADESETSEETESTDSEAASEE